MNGFIKSRLAIGLLLASGLTGCYCYQKCVDPCWPQRYNYMARAETLEAVNAQANNGHILDQTVWNHFFENDPKTGRPTDKLNALGRQHLTHMAQRRPNPDPKVFLQTAQDVTYDSENPNKMAETRNELDTKRIEAIQKFLNAQTAGRGLVFQVQVHDPAEVGIPAVPVDRVVHQMYESFRGRLGGTGASVTGGAGAVPTGTGGR